MNNKRKTLQKIAGFGAVAAVVPSSWIKPLVSSVILPAHAQTSVDAIAPQIVVDTTPITLTIGDALTPPVATCTDDIDTSCSVVVDISAVDTTTAGSYEIVYTAIDSAGNSSEVIVIVEVQVPTICSPMVFEPVTANCGAAYSPLSDNTYLSVDESGLCPVLVLDPAPSPVGGASYPLRDALIHVREDPATVRILVFQADASDFLDDAIGVRGGGGATLNCVPGEVIQIVKPQPTEIFIRGSNGGRYSAIFDIDVTADSLMATLSATTVTLIQ